MKTSPLILSLGIAGALIQSASAATTLYSENFETATPGNNAAGPGGFIQVNNVQGTAFQVQGGGGGTGISMNTGIDANGVGGSQALYATWDHSAASGFTFNQYTVYGIPGAGPGIGLADIMISLNIFMSGSESSTTPIAVSFQNNSSGQNFIPTLVNDSYTLVQFTLDQGFLAFGTGVDPTASFNFQVNHGAGGFGFDANNTVRIDNVSISVIPEPATGSLLALGGVAVAMLRRRRS